MVRSKVENGPYEVTGFLPQEAPSIPEKPSLVSPQGRDRRPQKDLWKSPKHKILLVVKQGSAVVSTRPSGGGGILILVIVVVVVTFVNYGNFGFWKFIGFLDFLILEN